MTGSYYRNDLTGEVVERQVLNERLNLNRLQEPPSGWERVRVEPLVAPIDALLPLPELPEPGIRVTIEFLKNRKRYSILLPPVEGAAAAEKLVDHVANLVTSTIQLHVDTMASENVAGSPS